MRAGAWYTVFLAMALGLARRADDPGEVRFARDVAPIVVKRCLSCHNEQKAFAHYRVDTFARLMAPSDAGPNIEPGQPDDSLFLALIVLSEPTGRMPKNASPLHEAEVQVIRRWIERGAKADGVAPDARLVDLVGRRPDPKSGGNP